MGYFDLHIRNTGLPLCPLFEHHFYLKEKCMHKFRRNRSERTFFGIVAKSYHESLFEKLLAFKEQTSWSPGNIHYFSHSYLKIEI